MIVGWGGDSGDQKLNRKVQNCVIAFGDVVFLLTNWAVVGNCIERGWALGDEKRMGAGGNDSR